jgi:hypothetical protein
MSYISEELDDSWINDFEENDKPYNELYKEDLFTIYLNILYINKDNTIEKIKKEIFFMQNANLITREEIIRIIKNNSNLNSVSYSLLSILKYNITMNPEDVNVFLKTNNFDYYNDKYFTTLKHIDSISFEQSIVTFHDLNTLFILFYEKDVLSDTSNINNTTKKIYWRPIKHKNRHKNTIRR